MLIAIRCSLLPAKLDKVNALHRVKRTKHSIATCYVIYPFAQNFIDENDILSQIAKQKLENTL